MEVTEIIISKPNYMKAKFRFLCDSYSPKESQKIVLEYSIIVKVKGQFLKTTSPNQNMYEVFIQFINIHDTDGNRLSKIIELSSESFKIESRKFLSNDDTDCWHLVGMSESVQHLHFDISLSTIANNYYSLNILDDTEGWTDFELVGEGGSIKVHRFALALVSPVFRRMLSTNCWKETREGCMTIDGVSIKTLEHMKSYIYEKKLPDSDLKPLLLLANYYEITNLEQDCVNKIMGNVSDADIYDMLEFGITNKVHRMSYAILNNSKFNNEALNKVKSLINEVGSSSIDGTEDK